MAADHGDPTTRKRLYMIAQKNRAVSFPLPTHSKDGRVPDTKPWVPARKVIDWTLKGESVFLRRDPHVPKTLRRCAIGFEDQIAKAPLARAYVTSLTMFRRAAEIFHEQMAMKPTESKLDRKLTKDERAMVRMINDRARNEHRLIVEEMFREPVAVMEWSDLIRHEMPEPMITAEPTDSTPNPFVCKLYGTGVTQPVSEPLDTVTAGGGKYTLTSPVSRPAGSGNVVEIGAKNNDATEYVIAQPPTGSVLAESFIVTVNHGSAQDESRRHSSLDVPTNVVTSRGADGLVTTEATAVEGFILRANASDSSSWDDAHQSIAKPLRAITTKNNLGFVQADSIIIPQQDFGKCRTRSIDEPVEAITAIARQGLATPAADIRDGIFAGVQPATVNLKGQSTSSSVDEPLPTSTAHARHFGCATPSAEVVPEAIMLPQDHVDQCDENHS